MTLWKTVFFPSFAAIALLVPAAYAQFGQQGGKLVGTGTVGAGNKQGIAAALSNDGNTAIVGGNGDGNTMGAAWVYTRSGGAWTQQGAKLVGTGASGQASQGTSVAISQDGNTALIGGPADSNGLGAAWVFTRNAGTWTQQGNKLVGAGAINVFGTAQGSSVALSSDGNTAVVGGPFDNIGVGALWVFTRTGGVWTQQAKLTPNDANPAGNGTNFGWSVALSSDGNTVIGGAPRDSGNYGTVWVFTRTGSMWTQQGTKIFGDGAATVPAQGTSVALSSDGNVALVGGPRDDVGETQLGTGATWVFTRGTDGKWTQQGAKLVGTGADGRAQQGFSVSLSGDGNLALVGGPWDAFAAPFGVATFGGTGAAWAFARSNGVWAQVGAKLVGTGSSPNGTSGGSGQGYALRLSTDGTTALVGGPGDTNSTGAAWAFSRSTGPAARYIVSAPAAAVINTAFNFTVTALDASNNVAGGYNGTVRFTSTDAAATLPPNATLSNGIGSFPATLKTAGARTITATDTVNASLTGTSAAVSVTSVAQPVPVGVSPSSGSGASQTMVFTFADPQGAQSLGVLNILINRSLDGRQACYLAYSRPANVLYLVADDGGTLLPGSVLTASGSTSNSQCGVSWAASPVVTSGNTLTITLNMTFTAAFAGNRIVYMAARDVVENNSGWQALGVWQAPGGTQTTATSVLGMNPARGSGLNQNTFVFNFSDTKGFQDLGVMNVLVNTSVDGRQGCYLAFSRPGNVLYLVANDGGTLLPGQSLAAAGSISNSQCMVAWGAGAVSGSGNNLSLTLTITFAPVFGGNRVFFVAARDVNEANNTDWQAKGTFTVQ